MSDQPPRHLRRMLMRQSLNQGVLTSHPLPRIPIRKHIFSGMPHAFRGLPNVGPSFNRWDDLTCEAMEWILDGNAASDNKGVWKEEVPVQSRQEAP